VAVNDCFETISRRPEINRYLARLSLCGTHLWSPALTHNVCSIRWLKGKPGNLRSHSHGPHLSTVNVRQVYGLEGSADCRVIDGRQTVVPCMQDAGCRVAARIPSKNRIYHKVFLPGVCFTQHLPDTVYNKSRRRRFSVTCYVIMYSDSPAAAKTIMSAHLACRDWQR